MTSANVANAMGVAVGSVLFMRWLNFYGLASGSVPSYTQWGGNPEIFVKAFQGSWTIIPCLAAIATFTSALRGVDRRERGGE